LDKGLSYHENILAYLKKQTNKQRNDYVFDIIVHSSYIFYVQQECLDVLIGSIAGFA